MSEVKDDGKPIAIGGKRQVWVNQALLGAIVVFTGWGAAQFTGLKGEVGDANNSLESLSQDVKEIKTTINQQGNGLIALQVEIRQLRADNAEVKAELKATQSRVRELEKK